MRSRLFPLITLLLLTWGALAFGAEYAWAYAPLLVLSLTAGVFGLSTSLDVRSSSRSVLAALVAVLLAGVVQLIPLPLTAVTAVSPAATAVSYGQLYAKATMQPDVAAPVSIATARRSLSIAPSRTVLGLVFLAAFAILLVGCVRGIGAVGPHSIARGILVLGVLVAFLELMQRASGSQVGYGFWNPPPGKGLESAPFINRNHTAGWLLMALSLSAGRFAGAVVGGLPGVKPHWRNRIQRLSSRDSSETLLTGFAVAMMAISIVSTASRSGSACLALAIIVFGGWVRRTLPPGARKTTILALLLAVLLTAVSVGGMQILADRLRRTSWSSLDGRLGIWQDTLTIVRDFPLAGTGLNTYGIAMLHYQTVKDGYLYIEAHDDYLQLAAEGGLLLGVPIVIALALFIREVWRRFRERADDTRTYWLRAGAVTGLCAIAVQELSDFTLQMPGATVLFVVLAAVAIHRPAQVSQPNHPVRQAPDGILPNVE